MDPRVDQLVAGVETIDGLLRRKIQLGEKLMRAKARLMRCKDECSDIGLINDHVEVVWRVKNSMSGVVKKLKAQLETFENFLRINKELKSSNFLAYERAELIIITARIDIEDTT